ncbi:MAG: hypothetical protein Q7J38_06335 [Gallionella sp.]|nr:hypothetical protein [Gallionella sp.]
MTKSGVNNYIGKPVKPDSFAKAVSKLRHCWLLPSSFRPSGK